MKKMRISFQRLFCCFILMLSSGVPVTAGPTDPVTIPDAVLRSRIEDALLKSAGATITEADMATLTSITSDHEHDIRELTGLEYAVNLKRLTLIRSIPQTRAELFARPFWRTADLAPISKLTKLEWLSFQGVVIFDMTPIVNLTSLRALTFNYTYGITRIPDLSNLTELLHLRLLRNEITDISGVRGLTKLQQLDLGLNPNLSDITPLTQLSTLEILRLDQTLVTQESLAAVLPFMSTEIDQMQSTDFPLISIESGEFGISGTNISDLSVLDNFPDVFLVQLYLQHMGSISQRTYFFHLKDLTPLVKLMNKPKLINSKTDIFLAHNYGLDYTSFYEEIPALIAGSKSVRYVENPNPQLEREFPKGGSYEWLPGSPVTFKVRAVNTNPDFPDAWLYLRPHGTGENRQFAEVPVTWKVTAPDGTVTEQKVPTGDDGLSSFTFTLGNDGETHTVEAILPAKTNPQANLSHGELKVTFTATAIAPPVITLTLHREATTQTSLQWIAEVSGSLPEAYVHYYKKSASRDWIEVGNLGRGARIFSFVHFELQPSTSYDFQLFALKNGRRFGTGSNVLTARTLSRTPPRPPPPEPPPQPPAPANNPPAFTSASTVSVQENTTAVIRIVAEDTDSEDAITNYAITGGPDRAMLEIGGTGTPSDMLRFKAAPDFEMPQDADTDNVCIVILTATSGTGDRELTAKQTLTITVTDVDETPPPPPNRPPVFRSASAINVAENTTAVVTVVAEDPDADDEITNYAITGGADQARFEIHGESTPSDLLRFKAAPDFEMPQDANKDNVYTVILTATSGVGDRELTANQTLTITVTDVDERPPNRPPVFTSASTVNVAENTTAVVTVVAEDPDADDEITNYAITGGADRTFFEIHGTSTPSDLLRFKAAPDFETPQDADTNNVYILILTATSGVGDRELTANQTLTITVTDVDETPPPPPNRPPVFTSASTVNVAENTTAVIRIVAEDPDADDEITRYAITGGADQAFFELGGTRSPSDLLRFKTAPDFEMPQDVDTNNVYILVLTATSGIGNRALSAIQILTITVTDVDEPVEPPVQPPVEPPVEPPVQPPVEPPVEPPVQPPVEPPVEPPVQPPVEPPVDPPSSIEPPVFGGSAPTPRPPLPLVTQCFIFNEIGNASDDRNDWIELKNLSNAPLYLSDWQIRLMSEDLVSEGIGVVSFPDMLLPAQGVLLITNTDPNETRLASGLNIGTGGRLRGAQHLYLVAPDLKLPSTPYLLILQRRAAENGDPPTTIEDVAGNYFRRVSPYTTEVYPLANTSRPNTAAAPLTDVRVWQRQHLEHPGYLAAAWRPSAYHSGLGYDRHAEASVSLGTPGYRLDPSLSLPVAYRLVFNEIRNASNDTDDYIELKNVCGAGVELSEWEISIVAAAGETANRDVDIVSFPDYAVPMGGVLLITNTDPSETRLAGGLNIATGARSRGAQHPYFVAPDLKLPSTPYLLILRHAREKNGTPAAIEDVAGNYFRRSGNTAVWPLADTRRPTAPAAPLTDEGTWQRRDVRERGYLAAAWTESTSPTGLGYDRHAFGENAPGAPGYGAAVGFNATLPDEVRFSELMFSTEGASRWVLPQWIELYNTSETPVNLKGWALVVETRTAEVHRHARLTLNTLSIPPKQTVLLVTHTGRNEVALPLERVYDLSAAHPDAFRHRRLGDRLLGSDGFFLKLTHPTGRVVDTCGNLDGDPHTTDPPTWMLPDPKTPQGHRTSLLRRFQDGDVRKGTTASGWMSAGDVAIGVTHYYGDPTDISTPNFLHPIVPGASPTVALSISEIMFAAPPRRPYPYPQWIELYNPSLLASVNLKGFQCVIETRQDGRHHQSVIDLEAFDVLPNQTVLLITGTGRHSGHFPANRTYNLSQRHPKAFRAPQFWQRLLGSEGFFIQLADATGNVVDTVGNLDGTPFTEDTPAWVLPPGETPEGARASIRRLSEKQGFPLDGRYSEAWVSTAAVPPVIMTYYGHHSDIGNPGYRMGGPLPVVLSSFRAMRDADTVRISWTTESSLENAGFHILRSTQRKSGFIRVNPRLIQGAGTTAERQTYTYVDKPPKADGVYYYQLQEVSYSGQQQVLATARIKGQLSADGKHLTTLGALKTRK